VRQKFDDIGFGSLGSGHFAGRRSFGQVVIG